MPYRNIFIANKASLKLKNNQLIVFNGNEFSFPVEDIKSIVIDSEQTTISARLISFLAENGVCLIICDDKHMPNSQLVPMSVFCRVNKRINLQISQTAPKLKRIWQMIVSAKIENQAKCLEFNDKEQKDLLFSIAKSVKSGDSTNREGYAASLYFKALFGKDFTRSDENNVNAALNYGYSILRAYIAKTVVSYGLEPSLGIYHKNQLNAFNLADDIIEPFRPVVDLYVYQNYKNWNDNFSTPQKAELQLLLNSVCKIGNDNCSVSRAIDVLVQSIISSYENEKTELKTPTLCITSFFDYE